MKPKMMLKMCIDLIMTVLLLCQMAYMLIGEVAHEWMGTAMFLLFIMHHALNWKWYRNLMKGRYTRLRFLQTVVDFLMLGFMIGLMVSGIIMSREVFTFLDMMGSMNFSRMLHMVSAYWGFILMSLHLGLHWGTIMAAVRRSGLFGKVRRNYTRLLRILAFVISSFGVYAFVKNDIASYLFMQKQFVFFDMFQPLLLFFADYGAMMGLWASTAYYGARIMQNQSVRKKE